jgi:hypothetical protein
VKGVEALVHTFFGVVRAGWTRPDILHIHCIGPALLVPLARALGLRDLSTAEARVALCGTCHRGAGTRLTAPALDVTPETVH